MSKQDLELGLLAALLHDISQYPMAHDLTENDPRFAHEGYIEEALTRRYGTESSLAHVIWRCWGIRISSVMRVLNAGPKSNFRYRLLNSVINGVLDCDKLDYLRRDSTHLGVNFGLAIDHERLMRNLTVVYGRATVDDGGDAHLQQVGLAEIGVSEKALVVAKALVNTRRDMFTQVYWQHTTRSLKAMLGFVVRDVLLRAEPESDGTLFWHRFRRFVFDHSTYYSSTASNEPVDQARDLDAITRGECEVLPELVEEDGSVSSLAGSKLHPGDDGMLTFLQEFSSAAGAEMVRAIRKRSLYQRIAVLSGARDPNTYKDLYDKFRMYRSSRWFSALEEERRKWQGGIIKTVLRRMRRDPSLAPSGFDCDAIEEAIARVEPLILVDVPIKALGRAATYIRFLREDYEGVHGRSDGFQPRFASFLIEKDETEFDVEVGKIRVLAHPAWRSLLVRCVRDREIFRIIKGEILSEADDDEFFKKAG
jgi:hypothetical protein